MIIIGIMMMVVGVIVLVGTQFFIRNLINQYKKSWEDPNEVR